MKKCACEAVYFALPSSHRFGTRHANTLRYRSLGLHHAPYFGVTDIGLLQFVCKGPNSNFFVCAALVLLLHANPCF